MLHELGYQAGHGDKQQTVESNQPGSQVPAWPLTGVAHPKLTSLDLHFLSCTMDRIISTSGMMPRFQEGTEGASRAHIRRGKPSTDLRQATSAVLSGPLCKTGRRGKTVGHG